MSAAAKREWRQGIIFNFTLPFWHTVCHFVCRFAAVIVALHTGMWRWGAAAAATVGGGLSKEKRIKCT